MKTMSIQVDDATWQAAAQMAEIQHTSISELVAGFVRDVAAQRTPIDARERRAQARKELVSALAESKAVVGERPTRDRTYSDRRFHRY